MSTSVASLSTNFFPSAENGFTTTTSGSVASAATTVGLNSVAGYTNGEVVVFVIDPTDATKKQTFTGVIDTSGSQVTSVVWTAGTNQTHALGATVVDYAAATHISMMTKGLLISHAQDGTLLSQAVRDALNLDSGSSDGWTPFGYSLTSITALGNRSYTAVVSGVDTTAVTSVGMRLKLPRTVTAPTYMGGAFNGSSHYFTKVTPTGTLSTVTNNWTIMAHVEPTAYTLGTIAARSDATPANSIFLEYAASGQINFGVRNGGSGNYRYVSTYQSLPLNKKTHVAASWTGGTVVIYLDGVSVPVTAATTAGTNPTTAGTGGDFSVGRLGAYNGNYFPGYISSVGVFDAVLTQATVRLHMNQALTGSETNCIGAWNLNNAATDASAAANNLTATGGVGYTARSPYTNSVTGTSVTAGTTNYGIIMAQTFSTNTTYTIQIPEGETLPTTGGIGTVSYSTQKTPYGFPGQRGKWRISYIRKDSGAAVTSNATFGAYHSNSWAFSVPTGEWDVGISINGAYSSSTTAIHFSLSSTALTGLTQDKCSDIAFRLVASSASPYTAPAYVKASHSLSSMTTYIIYTLGATTGGGIDSSSTSNEMFAENSYL